MRGSVRKRGSTYSYWLDIGPNPVIGKRRQRTKGRGLNGWLHRFRTDR